MDRGFLPTKMENSEDETIHAAWSDINATFERPAYLNGQKQFTTKQVVSSKVVSSLRTAVESTIRQLKTFTSLGSTWRGHSAKALEDTLSIAAAL